MWSRIAPYLYQVLVGLAAFLVLMKDWKDYGKLSEKLGRWVPLMAAVATLAVTGLGIEQTYSDRLQAQNDRREATAQSTLSERKIDFLTTQVKQLREDNKSTTDGFRKSFAQLYDKFSALQAKVTNRDLQIEIEKTRAELIATQKKLTTPKANVVSSFYTLNLHQFPIRELTASLSGASVTVDLMVYNTSPDAPALKGAVFLRICDACKYASEPAGFLRVSGAPETDRTAEFEDILPGTAFPKITLQVIPPAGSVRFEITVYVKCETCANEEAQNFFVNWR